MPDVTFNPVSLGETGSYSTGNLWHINTSIISHWLFKFWLVSNEMSQCFLLPLELCKCCLTSTVIMQYIFLLLQSFYFRPQIRQGMADPSLAWPVIHIKTSKKNKIINPELMCHTAAFFSPPFPQDFFCLLL